MRIRQSKTDWQLIYDAFLQSTRWKAMRALVFKRCGGICEACLTSQATQAHHTSYPPTVTLETLGAQSLWQIRGVCNACHAAIHGKPVAAKAAAPPRVQRPAPAWRVK